MTVSRARFPSAFLATPRRGAWSVGGAIQGLASAAARRLVRVGRPSALAIRQDFWAARMASLGAVSGCLGALRSPFFRVRFGAGAPRAVPGGRRLAFGGCRPCGGLIGVVVRGIATARGHLNTAGVWRRLVRTP